MNPEIIEQILQEVGLERRGATLYYALDPFDLVTFCFPVFPGDRTLRNLDQVADEQAALYEVVFGREPLPIFMEEYVNEIESILRYLQTHIAEAHDKARASGAFIKAVRKERASLTQSILCGRKKTVDPTDFNVVLAVVLGIYKLGIQRFEELYDRLSPPTDPDVQLLLWELDAEYQESEQTEWLVERISALVPRGKQESAEDDARAIDRLLFLNSRLERAVLENRLRNRHIFLYL